MSLEWYAMQSKLYKEELLCAQLIARGFEVFYPKLTVKPVNPRSRKVRPYFPGYLFVYADLIQCGSSILQFTPFARGLVSFDNQPAAVPGDLITAIRQRVEEANNQLPHLAEKMKHGQPIFIHSGPFAGYSGIFDLHLSGTERARVLIEILSRRYLPIDLPSGQITPLKKE
jgi:transcription antitermination factor NusG